MWCPQRINASTWTPCECSYTYAELWCNKRGTYPERLTPPFVKEETPFQNTQTVLE
jgi:hypothetical protein